MSLLPACLLPLLLGLPQGPSAKRAAPPEVPPVTGAGVTYRAPNTTPGRGLVRAEETATGKKLWEAAIFETSVDPHLEADVQAVFITRLRLKGGSLEVLDERKRVFLLDLETRKVRRRR